MATLQEQLDRAEDWYDDNLAFGNGADLSEGIWQRQHRWFNVAYNNKSYAQLVRTHVTNPMQTEVSNGDKVMERPSVPPYYEDQMTWNVLLPELVPIPLPANYWCYQWNSRNGKGFDVHMELDYNGRDITPTPQTWRQDIVYDGTDRGKKSGWYQVIEEVTRR